MAADQDVSSKSGFATLSLLHCRGHERVPATGDTAIKRLEIVGIGFHVGDFVLSAEAFFRLRVFAQRLA
jgi:hypothetical protein